MDHFVNLDKLPDDLQFPPDMKERIHFEAESHRLVYHGYMSKSDFDRLSQLTRDWTFRRRLEDLFRLSVMGDAEQPQGARRLFSRLARLFSLG